MQGTHGNGTMQKIVRTRPVSDNRQASAYSGKQWKRADKRAVYSQK